MTREALSLHYTNIYYCTQYGWQQLYLESELGNLHDNFVESTYQSVLLHGSSTVLPQIMADLI